MTTVLLARLNALASAHAFVLPVLADGSDHPLDLASVLNAILQPHRSADGVVQRFAVHGPPFECDQRAVTSIALVFHELATNAVKYGSLQNEAGSVHLSWQSRERSLTLKWKQIGAKSVAEPAHTGFGTKLVLAAVSQLHGSIEFDWRDQGLSVSIAWPESAVGKSVELP